jgi:hypothetical protein
MPGVLRRLALSTAVAVSIALTGAAADAANKAVNLSGFDEVPVVITDAKGRFVATIANDRSKIDYRLNYEGVEGDVTQAHFHLGQKHVGAGSIVVFLCTNLGNAPGTVPVPQSCPASPGSITGTITAADVIARTEQGVAAGDLDAVIDGILQGVIYVNVHSTISPPGVIRGNFAGHH